MHRIVLFDLYNLRDSKRVWRLKKIERRDDIQEVVAADFNVGDMGRPRLSRPRRVLSLWRKGTCRNFNFLRFLIFYLLQTFCLLWVHVIMTKKIIALHIWNTKLALVSCTCRRNYRIICAAKGKGFGNKIEPWLLQRSELGWLEDISTPQALAFIL